MVLNSYCFFRQLYKEETVVFAKRISTVQNIRREKILCLSKGTDQLSTPGKHRSKISIHRDEQSFFDNALRCKVHQLIREKQLPTLEKIKSRFNADPDLSCAARYLVLLRDGKAHKY